LEEFAPRLNAFVKSAREQGMTIIHAPSDCMPAYEGHPARQRAIAARRAARLPAQIGSWCSRIPAEEQAHYPIDQSDGGEDDDPQEHAAWAEKLKQLGRNPQLPWKTQSALIDIDKGRDYISDRGDEVWNILEACGVENVFLVGVHVNMCVLGRPFGLRQMVRNGKQTVLVRDLTDAMYNPQRWPYVDHYTGTDLVLAHIERYVCPTTTSDQLLGGQPFTFQSAPRKGAPADLRPRAFDPALLPKTWQAVAVPNAWQKLTDQPVDIAWYRCNLRINAVFARDGVQLSWSEAPQGISAWWNGTPLLKKESEGAFAIPAKLIQPEEAHLLVVRQKGGTFLTPPTIAGSKPVVLQGRWEVRVGDDATWSNMPLPPKFGAATDIYFEP
jgi:nicotinamidase-related amidase